MSETETYVATEQKSDEKESEESSSLSKRQRDESEVAEEELKKNKNAEDAALDSKAAAANVKHITYEEVGKIAASQVPAAAPIASITSKISPSGDSEIIECSQEKVGQIIGSKGAIIQDMVDFFVQLHSIFCINNYYFSKLELVPRYM